MYQEYESCSSLFMSEGGTFAIMVDSNLLTSKETIEATYNCRVGSYIDRILDSTSAGENKPKIQLVVTKVTPATDKDALFGILFEMTRKHLESKQGDSAYLVDRVMKSPHSDHLTRESLQEQYEMMITLSSDEKINPRPDKNNPADWFALRDKAQEMEVVKFDHLIDMLDEVKSERVGTGTNNSPELLANLHKFSEILEIAVKKPTTGQPTVNTPISKQAEHVGKQTAEEDANLSSSLLDEVPVTNPRSTEAHNVCHESQIESSDEVYNAKKQEMTAILTYLSQSKELLWFPEIEAIKDLVIPKVDTLIRSIRVVINHNPREHFVGTQMKTAREAYEQTGILAFEDFKTIYKRETEKEENKNKEFLDEDTAWKMIKHLGSGCPFNHEETENEKLLFPYLAKKETKDIIEKTEKKEKGEKEAICLEYTFDHNRGSTHSFYQLLQRMMSGLQGNQVDVVQTFSQTAEDRHLGSTRGIRGSLVWPNKEVRDNSKYNFLLLEHTKPHSEKRWFASERCIQVNLVPHGDEDARGGQAFQILQMIDSILRKDTECVYRSLLCKECHNNGDSSNFVLKEDQFIRKKDVCSGDQRHSIDIGTNKVLKGESKILLS